MDRVPVVCLPAGKSVPTGRNLPRPARKMTKLGRLGRCQTPCPPGCPLDVDVCRAACLPDAAEIRRLAVPQPFGGKRRLPGCCSARPNPAPRSRADRQARPTRAHVERRATASLRSPASCRRPRRCSAAGCARLRGSCLRGSAAPEGTRFSVKRISDRFDEDGRVGDGRLIQDRVAVEQPRSAPAHARSRRRNCLPCPASPPVEVAHVDDERVAVPAAA